uniref:SFRICE_030921 n=1 Tax=Spodoptera frugiperda TaxID=7108 RepID=A0A2H1X147_SPOFR
MISNVDVQFSINIEYRCRAFDYDIDVNIDVFRISIIPTLLSGWIARFGCPSDIVTDRGRQFESALFKCLSGIAGFQHCRTTAYHPACNGLVERFHRQLKAAITCHANVSWVESLPLVLLGVRSAFKEDAQASAAELVYGQPLRLPGEFFDPQADETIDTTDYLSRLRSLVRQLRPSPAARHNKYNKFFIFKDLPTSSHVFLRDCTAGGFKPAYSGPHKVIERGDKVYKIVVNGKQVTVSIDRIKPAFILRDPDTPYTPPTTNIHHNTFQTPSNNNTHQNTPNADNRNLLDPGDGIVKATRSGRRVKFPDYYRP